VPSLYKSALFLCCLAGIAFSVAGTCLLRGGQDAFGIPALAVGIAGTLLPPLFLLLKVREDSGHARLALDHLCELQKEVLRSTLLSAPKYHQPGNLNHAEVTAFSQSGEDGILAAIFERIGTTNRFCVEFGLGDSSANNTTLLLKTGWSALWIEGDSSRAAQARELFAPWVKTGKLKVRQEFITAENIEQIFRSESVPPQLDLLSIDLDQSDYWIWRAMEEYRARVVVIEYNSTFPPGVEWVAESGTSEGSGLDWGVSLSALERLAEQKQYKLVGCTLNGTNAFFVRADLVEGKFSGPFTAARHYEPRRYFLAVSKDDY